MESADDGKTQFMYSIGQLSEEYDLFWDQEFKGYHGLRRMEDIKRFSMNNVCSQKLTPTELDHYYLLMKGLCPIVKDEICFQLLSMVLMFDTTNLMRNDPISFLVDETLNQSLHSLEISGQVSFHGSSNSTEMYTSDTNTSTGGNSNMANGKTKSEDSTNRRDSFDEIKSLQEHYIKLLKRRCMVLKGPQLRKLVAPGGLKMVIICFKLLAQYVPPLM